MRRRNTTFRLGGSSAKRCPRSLVILLMVLTTGGGAGLRIGIAHAAEPLGDGSAYELTYSNIALGGVASAAGEYAMVDSMTWTLTNAEYSQSEQYELTSPMGIGTRANNGLVIGTGVGTEVNLSWQSAGPITVNSETIRGYHVYRSLSGEAGTYEKANEQIIVTTSYTDHDLPNGYIHYMVYYETLDGQLHTLGDRSVIVAIEASENELDIRLVDYLLGWREEGPLMDMNLDEQVNIADLVKLNNEY